MIYVDTATGKLVIDTNSESERATILITRDITGTHIQYRKLKSGDQASIVQRVWRNLKNQANWSVEFQ